MPKKVLAAMSGGVDSSVAAYLLKNQGYDVIGITMRLWDTAVCGQDEREKGCCNLEGIEDARRVAGKLDIPYYVLDFNKKFKEKVVDNFCEEYSKGRTPNPCARCNQYIKFKELMLKAKQLGADYIATGHHSKIRFDKEKNRYLLIKSFDVKKDQTYFLYTLSQNQLAHTLMPIGDLEKKEVRKIAKELGLHVAEKKESQEICFVMDDNYHNFLSERIPEAIKPGNIIDAKGNALGKHDGLPFYTIGQRRGIGVAAKEPLYVKELDVKNNTVIVGTRDELFINEIYVSSLNYIAIDELTSPLKANIKIRYRQDGKEGTIIPIEKDKVKIVFEESVWGVAPGQSAVFYDGDVVIGGGVIGGESEKIF